MSGALRHSCAIGAAGEAKHRWAQGRADVFKAMHDGQDAEIERVAMLARLLGVALRPADLADVARYWRLMQDHRARVAATPLAPDAEPAALFRP
jgi:hypothetical protein